MELITIALLSPVVKTRVTYVGGAVFAFGVMELFVTSVREAVRPHTELLRW
jgi:hypothetical protein